MPLYYLGLVVTEPAPLLFFFQVSYNGELLPNLVSNNWGVGAG